MRREVVFLAQQADASAGRDDQGSVVGAEVSGQHRQQRGLARAVAAADEQAVAGAQLEVRPRGQCHPAAQRQLGGLQQRLCRLVGDGRQVEGEEWRWRGLPCGDDVVESALE